jgi:hypothetical protein
VAAWQLTRPHEAKSSTSKRSSFRGQVRTPSPIGEQCPRKRVNSSQGPLTSLVASCPSKSPGSATALAAAEPGIISLTVILLVDKNVSVLERAASRLNLASRR